ncbi:Calcium-dependent protein kinase 20 [Zea mays]|uniref:non-specific serine/threonine protein kinase n=1 Tax=Zea mays TaxID=4577 RepID=A0A1D6F9X3_MAIZE|nr:Calcium-dependent protein kinase 20 [Zea mays]
MGNTCIGPSAPSDRHSFFNTVSLAVLWRPPAAADRAEPSPTAEPSSSTPCSPPSRAPNPVTISDSEHPPHSTSTALGPAAPPNPNGKPKPKPKVKRVQSAGLLAGSVLKRDSERLKDVYTLGKKLGQGQFGTTYQCVEKATGKHFACKSIAKRKLVTDEDVEDVRREIQIMHHLAGHPNVVSIVGAYEDAVAVHLVMELCAGGELFDRIIQRGHYSEKAAAQLARVIIGVVEACHSLGVMHRDLKPENFLFVNQKEDAPLKAIDFGLSIFFKPGEIFSDVVGSPYYVAPEVIAENLSEDEIAGLKEMFKMLDTDNSGQITLEELKIGLKRVGANLKDSEITTLMEAADIDNSGSIDYGEFLAATLHLNKVEREDNLFAAFSYFDKDGSGYITHDELQKACEEFGIEDAHLEDIIHDVDQDNDGRIDYNEFVTMMQKGNNPLGKKGHCQMSFGLREALKLG